MEAFLASIQRFAKPWIPAQLAGPLDSMDGHIAGFTGITGLALPLLLLLSLVLCIVLTRMLFGDSASTSTNKLVWLHSVLTVFGLLWLAIACFCFACARSGEGGLPHGDRVLLLGDSGAGKTVMFYQVKLFDFERRHFVPPTLLTRSPCCCCCALYSCVTRSRSPTCALLAPPAMSSCCLGQAPRPQCP